MEKIYVKIENYLQENFPGKKIVLRNDLKEKDFNDVWGITSILIQTRLVGNTVEYKPKFTK